mmetsp:Transcript_96098/g.200748  ORF Transcript_96098/g.200748 Transcript_96098/m.200748 type:complete len:202 (+) Transcript_96098:47-652(+)
MLKRRHCLKKQSCSEILAWNAAQSMLGSVQAHTGTVTRAAPGTALCVCLNHERPEALFLKIHDHVQAVFKAHYVSFLAFWVVQAMGRTTYKANLAPDVIAGHIEGQTSLHSTKVPEADGLPGNSQPRVQGTHAGLQVHFGASCPTALGAHARADAGLPFYCGLRGSLHLGLESSGQSFLEVAAADTERAILHEEECSKDVD